MSYVVQVKKPIIKPLFKFDIIHKVINFKTEWIKYMWSKKEILPHIRDMIKDLNIRSVFDGFAWTTRVWQFFNNNWIQVISNDMNIRSEVFGRAFLLNDEKRKKSYIEKIKHLNSLEWYKWYYTTVYWWIDYDWSSVQPDGKKRLRQVHNTMKLDAIRDEIDKIAEDEIEKNVLLASLIFSLDKVDSSLWHFSSYLRERSSRSYKNLYLELPYFVDGIKWNDVITGDVFDVLPKIDADLAYYDPPYGSNNDQMPSSRVRYGQYYHIWETIIRHDKPEVIWAINKRADATVEKTYSIFENYNKKWSFYIPELAIFDLIKKTKTKYILLSYNTNWRASVKNIIQFLEDNKYKYELRNIWYKKNVMAWMKRTYDWDNLWDKDNHEILLLIYNH